MTQLLAILQLISVLLPQLTQLGTRAIEAFTTNDQAKLDELHQQAIDLANTLRPAGQDPI